MKPNFSNIKEAIFVPLINKLNILFSNIGLDNFQYKMISDTTGGVAHTQKLVKHGLSTIPQFVLPREGNIYVHRIDATYVDIRSSQINIPFTIIIVG